MVHATDQFSSILEQERRRFLPPRIEAACQFLERLEAEKGGWPRYQEGTISLHHTSLVASALDAVDHDKFSVPIAKAALRSRSVAGAKLEELSLVDLVDFYRILRADRESNSTLVEQLAVRLHKSVDSQLISSSRLNVREFSAAIATLNFADRDSAKLLTSHIDHLLSLENAERGGWPGAPSGEPSFLATSDVIQTLAAIDAQKYADPIQRGARFLNAAITDRGWQSIAAEFGLFVQASMLRALGACESLDNVDTGIATLEDAVNSDGGWGPGTNQPSSIEITATSLEALVICGETRFVPYRVAWSTLVSASQRVETLERELAKAQQELDDRVSRQSKQILDDRNSLRRENDRLNSQIKSLQLESQEAQRLALEEARRNRYLEALMARRDLYSEPSAASPAIRLAELLSPFVILLLTVLLIAFMAWFDIGQDSKIVQSLVGMLAVATISMIAVRAYSLRETQRTRNLSRSLSELSLSNIARSNVSSTVLEFADIASELPPPLREEFAYILADRVIEMSPNIGTSYVDDVIRKLDFPRSTRARMLHWTAAFLELEPYGRRAVIDQIRRSVLLS